MFYNDTNFFTASLDQFIPLTRSFLVSEKECSIVEGCAGLLSSGMGFGTANYKGLQWSEVLKKM